MTPAPDPTLLAGAAETIITPPVGTPLEGYSGREGVSTRVHDDLHARALVVDDGETQAAIVSCDLVGIDRRLTAAVRERVESATGIPGAHIMVAATHTHAGPAGVLGGADPALVDATARNIAGAVIAAHAQKRRCVLKAGRGSVDSVSQNRRHPDWLIDDALRVLLFDDPDGAAPVASVVNFACHATVLYRTNLEISADYPGAVTRTVKGVVGDTPVLFLNGACANVNPSWTEQTFDEVDRVGSIVGSEAARRLQELRPLAHAHRAWNIRWDELTEKPVTSGELITPRIRVLSETIEVPLRQLDPPAAYDGRLAQLERERQALPPADVDAHRRIMEQITHLRGERGVASRLRPGGPHYLHPEAQAIGLGEGCAVLGLPGEFFVETAQAVQTGAGLPHLLISCYANHHVHYVVPKEAFAQGGYEPGVAMLDKAAEGTFRTAAIELLRRL
ncbi:MAG: neutral/alkaline non-lysosomal ceramidase N-terminal domain-containing protein [Dehalococcoidia bacterium]